MQAIDYSNYKEYTTAKTQQGWQVIPESLFDALKEDQANSMRIPFKVTFNKYVLSGIAEGLTIKETMKFVDWDDACSWAAAVTESLSVNFVILEMWGPNDEYEVF